MLNKYKLVVILLEQPTLAALYAAKPCYSSSTQGILLCFLVFTRNVG